MSNGDDLPTDVDWGDLFARGVVYARRRGRKLALYLKAPEAEDVSGKALTLIVENGWDRDRYPDPFDCLRSRINGVLIDLSRKKGTRNERVNSEQVAQAREPSRSPEQVAADRHLAGRATSLVLERLDGHDDATAVLMAMVDGHDSPAEIAEATGLPIKVVYRARERISVIGTEIAHLLALAKEPGG